MQEPLQAHEIKLFRNRTAIIGALIAVIFSLLVSRLWFLQIQEGDKHAELSKGNRIRLVAQAAPRGVIYDRKGVALADNRPAYQLRLIREDTKDLERSLKNLSEVLDIPYHSLLKKVEDNRRRRPFDPIILDADLEYKKAVLVETYQEEFPGISIVVESLRHYPNNKLASHILGYVGLRNEKQEKALPKNKLSSGRIVGQANMEALHNEALVGTDGGKQIEIDSVGRELRIMDNPIDPIPGKDIFLTIDIKLQQFIQSTMKNQSGVVVVMRPKTGEVLGMGSFPNYNPNLFSSGINRKNWNRLLNNPDHPLENKTVQGTYPPGSPFKLVTGYAGLDMGIIDDNTTFFCNGYFRVKGRRAPYKCWKYKTGGHGHLDLKGAIRESCNVYFYNVAMEVGVDKLHDYASKFGFGQKTNILLPNEKKGLVPSSAWKKKAIGEPWYKGETTAIAIGQGYLNVTPIQMINFVNIIANNGNYIQPQLTMSDTLPEVRPQGLNVRHLESIRKGMMAAVHEDRGTARKIRSDKYNFGGKTGTVQVVSHKTLKTLSKNKQNQRAFQNHAWFIAFGPVEDPEISVVVLVEHGQGGSTAAAPVAKEILDYYFDNIYQPEQAAHEDHNHIHESDVFADRLHAAFH